MLYPIWWCGLMLGRGDRRGWRFHDAVNVGWWHIWVVRGIVAMITISGCLGCKLLLRRRRNMESGIHSKSSLGGAGSTGGIRALRVVGLGRLLQGVEVGDAHAISIGNLAVHGAVDEGGSVGRHVGGWRGTLIPGQIRAARLTLPLVTR